MKVKNILYVLLIFFVPLSSCSLKYDEKEKENKNENTPEFIFEDLTFSRFENNYLKSNLTAKVLEQYADKESSYGKDITFETYSDTGELETEGRCSLISINSKSEIYTMYTNIMIKNISQGFELKAESLKFNSKTEQLTSAKNDKVFISKDNTQMEGVGFSASAVSNSFKFEGNVKGTYTSDDEEDTVDEEANINEGAE